MTQSSLILKAEIPMIPAKIRAECELMLRIAAALETHEDAPAIAPVVALVTTVPAGLAIPPVVTPESLVAAVGSPATAPVVAPVVTHPNPGNIELDKNGIPWDERIHAGTKEKNKDETWRSRRNLDPAIKAAVETELRALLANSAPAVATTPDPATVFAQQPATIPAGATAPTFVAPTPTFVAPPVVTAIPVPPHHVHPTDPSYVCVDGQNWVKRETVPGIPPLEVAAPVVVAPVVAPVAVGLEGQPTDWPSFMAKVTAMSTATPPRTDNARIAQALAEVGQKNGVNLQQLPQLAVRPDLIPQVAAYLDRVAGM